MSKRRPFLWRFVKRGLVITPFAVVGVGIFLPALLLLLGTAILFGVLLWEEVIRLLTHLVI